jgi:hypothetical protein
LHAGVGREDFPDRALRLLSKGCSAKRAGQHENGCMDFPHEALDDTAGMPNWKVGSGYCLVSKSYFSMTAAMPTLSLPGL